MAGEAAGSVADMVSAVSSIDMSGGDSGDTADAVDLAPSTETGDTVDVSDVGDMLAAVSPGEAEPEPEPVAATPETPVVPEETPPATDLPEGVREIGLSNGKKEMRITPQRWETIYGAHKTLRDFEALVGEPVTPDTLDLRQRAYMGQERLYGDLLSGEPEAQAKVLDHFIQEAQQALANGEVGTDPTIGLGQAFYDTMQAKAPDAFAHLRMRAAGDLVNEMYAEAQRTGNKNLALSVSHIAKALGLGHKNDAEILQFLATPPAQSDPLAKLREENQRLQQQISGSQSQQATERWQAWKGNTTKEVTSAVLSEAIMPSLSAEQEAWGKFPIQFENLVIKPLNSAVKQTIIQDKNFGQRIQLLEQSAQRATSEQKRDEIRGQIRQAYVNRAKLAADAHKPGILREAGPLLKQGNDATHARLQAAQGQRGPRGPQNPAPHSLIPGADVVNPGGVFDIKTETARLARLMG